MRHALQVLLLLVFLCTTTLYGQTPKYSNEFLSIGVGARAMGMFNAVTATANDVTAGYWNPAGLVHVPSNIQLSLMHAEYFAGIAKYDYAGLAAQIDATSTAAISVVRFGVDDIPDTTELIDSDGNINYDKIKSFSAVDLAIILSYGKRVSAMKGIASTRFGRDELHVKDKDLEEGLNMGLNAKIIRRKAGDFAQAWGFGFDLGAQYKINDWQLGAFAKDITTTYNAWSYNLSDETKDIFALTGNVIPENSVEITLPKIILGGARAFPIYKDFSALIALDLDVSTDRKRNVLIQGNPFSIDPHMGVELDWRKMVFFRTGIGNIQNETNYDGKTQKTFQLNMGVGVRISDILAIDYALTDIGDNSIALYSNIFSLRFNIYRRDGDSK